MISYKHFKCGVQEVNAKAIDIDTIIAGDDDVSHWRERHQLWYAQF